MNRFAFGKFEGVCALDLDLSDLRWLARVAKSVDRELACEEISRRRRMAYLHQRAAFFQRLKRTNR